jgi:hypothetical protein
MHVYFNNEKQSNIKKSLSFYLFYISMYPIYTSFNKLVYTSIIYIYIQHNTSFIKIKRVILI